MNVYLEKASLYDGRSKLYESLGHGATTVGLGSTIAGAGVNHYQKKRAKELSNKYLSKVAERVSYEVPVAAAGAATIVGSIAGGSVATSRAAKKGLNRSGPKTVAKAREKALKDPAMANVRDSIMNKQSRNFSKLSKGISRIRAASRLGVATGAAAMVAAPYLPTREKKASLYDDMVNHYQKKRAKELSTLVKSAGSIEQAKLLSKNLGDKIDFHSASHRKHLRSSYVLSDDVNGLKNKLHGERHYVEASRLNKHRAKVDKILAKANRNRKVGIVTGTLAATSALAGAAYAGMQKKASLYDDMVNHRAALRSEAHQMYPHNWEGEAPRSLWNKAHEMVKDDTTVDDEGNVDVPDINPYLARLMRKRHVSAGIEETYGNNVVDRADNLAHNNAGVKSFGAALAGGAVGAASGLALGKYLHNDKLGVVAGGVGAAIGAIGSAAHVYGGAKEKGLVSANSYLENKYNPYADKAKNFI